MNVVSHPGLQIWTACITSKSLHLLVQLCNSQAQFPRLGSRRSKLFSLFSSFSGSKNSLRRKQNWLKNIKQQRQLQKNSKLSRGVLKLQTSELSISPPQLSTLSFNPIIRQSGFWSYSSITFYNLIDSSFIFTIPTFRLRNLLKIHNLKVLPALVPEQSISVCYMERKFIRFVMVCLTLHLLCLLFFSYLFDWAALREY